MGHDRAQQSRVCMSARRWATERGFGLVYPRLGSAERARIREALIAVKHAPRVERLLKASRATMRAAMGRIRGLSVRAKRAAAARAYLATVEQHLDQLHQRHAHERRSLFAEEPAPQVGT